MMIIQMFTLMMMISVMMMMLMSDEKTGVCVLCAHRVTVSFHGWLLLPLVWSSIHIYPDDNDSDDEEEEIAHMMIDGEW